MHALPKTTPVKSVKPCRQAEMGSLDRAPRLVAVVRRVQPASCLLVLDASSPPRRKRAATGTVRRWRSGLASGGSSGRRVGPSRRMYVCGLHRGRVQDATVRRGACVSPARSNHRSITVGRYNLAHANSGTGKLGLGSGSVRRASTTAAT
jgi:hypothetical protein